MICCVSTQDTCLSYDLIPTKIASHCLKPIAVTVEKKETANQLDSKRFSIETTAIGG